MGLCCLTYQITAPNGFCHLGRSGCCQHLPPVSAGADLSPQSVFQNGRKCILVNVGGAAFPTAAGSGDGGAEAAEKPVRLLGPQIIGVDGNALQLKGVNWFGFDVRLHLR
jgi:hypothetical protein